MAREFEVRFDDVTALGREYERHWARGQAVIRNVSGLDPFMPVTLVLHHPAGGEALTVEGTVVSSPDEQVSEAQVRVMLDDGLEGALHEFASREASDDGGDRDERDDQADRDGEDDLATIQPTASERPPMDRSSKTSLAPQLRLKELTVQQQTKLARTSASLTERTTLERMLGRSAWESLLANPRVTVPEIARIARKGTVPRPLIEQIIENQGWTRNATVRRALLSNPKLTPELIVKVLRLAPKHEIKLIPRQTAYPAAVRTAAKRILGVD